MTTATPPAAKRVVVLVSGAGSNLGALLERSYNGEVVRVVSDQPGAGGLALARAHDIDAVAVDHRQYADRSEWEKGLREVVAEAAAELVVLAGFMRILSGAFVRRWPTLNVHPSLLPAFPGAHAVADALRHGVKVTGATVHFVVEQVDAGPIVAQESVAVMANDTIETLHARIKAVEHRLLPECVALFCSDRLAVDGRQVRILP
ncbi:MAG: phosphoribosylglycinamide formyltransferase [Actinomycetota bacterium]|nr:phosphoribosylglycinamide formyltransferase [Actinomycetota bacterium]